MEYTLNCETAFPALSMQEVVVRLKKDSSGSIGITLKASFLCIPLYAIL